jgi:hypothetical protein
LTADLQKGSRLDRISKNLRPIHPVDEQLHGGIIGCLGGERPNWHEPFPGNAEAFTAGRQHRDVLAPTAEFGHHGADIGHDMLTVVEDQQQATSPDCLADGVE